MDEATCVYVAKWYLHWYQWACCRKAPCLGFQPSLVENEQRSADPLFQTRSRKSTETDSFHLHKSSGSFCCFGEETQWGLWPVAYMIAVIHSKAKLDNLLCHTELSVHTCTIPLEVVPCYQFELKLQWGMFQLRCIEIWYNWHRLPFSRGVTRGCTSSHLLCIQHCLFCPGPPNIFMSRQLWHCPQLMAMHPLHSPHRFLFLPKMI